MSKNPWEYDEFEPLPGEHDPDDSYWDDPEPIPETPADVMARDLDGGAAMKWHDKPFGWADVLFLASIIGLTFLI